MARQARSGWASGGRAFMALALLALLFLAVQVIAGTLLRGVRLDLTENRLYTLSDGTRQVLGGLDRDIRFRFYFSDEAATGYPQLKAYARRVEDLLKQYRDLSGGRLSLEVIDPEPFSETEDEAVAAGLSGAATAGGGTVYFGLVATDEADGRATIGYFAPEREATLEYDVTKLLYEMTRASKPVLGVVTDLPMTFGPGGIQAAVQGMAQPYVIYDQLRQLFDVRMLGNGFDRIDADVDVLMVAHATEIGAAQYYAIDQYVLKGGKALVFVDPHSETAAAMAAPAGPMGMPQPGPATRSGLGPLLAAWGLGFDASKVVTDLELAQRVNMGADAPGGRQIVDYVAWLGVGPAQIAQDDIIAAELTQITLASAGALTVLADDPAGITPILQSSPQAALTDSARIAGRPDPDALIRDLLPAGEPFMLAARLRRPVASAYPDGPPAATPADHEEEPEAASDPDQGPLPAHVAASDGPVNVIVVADADMLEDRFWAQVRNFFGERIAVPVADNGRFVINAVDQLSGSDALISLRSRGVSARPFTLVEDIRRDADARYLREQERLEQELRNAEARLAELEGGDDRAADALLSPEQVAEIERFRAEAVETRRALRAVQRNLRQDIDRLEAWVRGLNIAAVPVLLVLIALWRLWRRRRAA